MPTQQCFTERKIAQTLFLGASVANFNISQGWGSQSSQLSVNLIPDIASSYCDDNNRPLARQFAVYDGKIPSNHYHDCVGDDCYMLADGSQFDSEQHDYSLRRTLGKVYYTVNNAPTVVPKTGKSNAVLSSYWFYPDPGFLGEENRINIDGSYINIYKQDLTNLNPGYDLINCPVYFKAGDISFGGIIQSWNRSISESGDIISVNVEDMKSVLSNCYVILDKFSGAIYSKIKNSDSFYGGPRNWAGDDVDYYGRLYNGNIPNVFNIYGFLESFGVGGFGGSNKNNNGISVNRILDALSVLTSSTSSGDNIFSNIQNGYAPKNAFSPFGRILTKTPQTTDTLRNVTSKFNSFGIIPPSQSIADNIERCQFVLDISEIPRFSDDYRISEPVLSITDLISRVCEESGYEFTIDLIPTALNGELLNVIKLKLVSRNSQPRPNEIQNTVRSLLCDGYSVGSVTYGKEKNDTNLKSVVIGGNQQRLLQIKSHRLSYSQSSLILNSKTLEFVNYNQLGSIGLFAGEKYGHGKYRFPSVFSTNNPDLSKIVNPNQSDLYDANEAISNVIANNDFSSLDTDYNDDPLLKSGQINQTAGNYYNTAKIPQEDAVSGNTTLDISMGNGGNILGENFRFFPLFKDAICPFFGYVRDEEIEIDLKGENNTDYRRIRPVYLDTWTGQVCVLIETHEFPQISINLIPTLVSSNKSYILVSESEIRAALAGFDNFLVYSLAKLYRPDLIESLRLGHRQVFYEKLLSEGIKPNIALDMANKKYDWFWRQVHGNIAGPFGQPVEIAPAKNDGSSYIDQVAIQDLQILHQFLNQIAGHYGKSYMVSLPNIQSYKDQQYSYITLPTNVGDSYVFHGGGNLYHNYEPVSDGAWEEPGNIIDDTIPVGGSSYYALAEADGRIGPILGYNSNKYLDYTKSEMCKFAQNMYEDNLTQLDDQKINPAWSYQIFDELLTLRDQDCPDSNFVFNGINLSSLPITDYIDLIVRGQETIPPIISEYPEVGGLFSVNFGGSKPIRKIGNFASNYTFNTSIARDAWGYNIGNEPMRKLYVKAQLSPKISYIEPENLFFPKAIINSPGLSLTTSSSQYKKDPNKTVIANVSSEDLILYLKTTQQAYWDYEFISYMLYYVSPNFQDQFKGNYAVSSNESASHVEIAPKAAHPFFAGIPIKFNNYVYGPWANNIYVDYLRSPDSIFPPGKEIRLSDTLPYTCTSSDISVDSTQARNMIDNFIGPTSIEIDEQLCPWNFGGSAFMDQVANIKAYSQLNYQAVIESAQIQMPGMPIFDLGSNFDVSSLNNSSFVNNAVLTDYDYVDVKLNKPYEKLDLYNNISLPSYIPNSFASLAKITDTISIGQKYKILHIKTPIAKPSTLITNIQVDIGSDGIISTYSLRTYTKKLSLFNKTEIDKINKIGQEINKRDKQIASIRQQNINIEKKQFQEREEKRLTEANSFFDSIGFSSKLFGWSPTKVLIGQANPFIQTLDVNPDYIPFDSLYVSPSGYNSIGSPRSFNSPNSADPGMGIFNKNPELLQNANTNIPTLMNTAKHKTDVGLYESKEIRAQLNIDYGMQSAMSLDGLFSPISFYPTHKNSTYNYTKYDIESCPFCRGTKKIKTEYKLYTNQNQPKYISYVYCDKCERKDQKLKYKLSSESTTQSAEILPPYIISNLSTLNVLEQFKSLGSSSSSSSTSSSSKINMLSLNPILVAVGELRNPNTQFYVGQHPEGRHGLLTIGNQPRSFEDRCRHSIELVARGAIPQRDFTISDGGVTINGHHPDFYDEDLILQESLRNRNTGNIPILPKYQMNQRFLGLRGPLTMHAWGYDTEGYPVPNAADEPLEFDSNGRPRRFKLKIKTQQEITYGSVPNGGVYYYSATDQTFVKSEEPSNFTINDNTIVVYYTFENDLNDIGGFMSDLYYGSGRYDSRMVGYQGDIISKTQQWNNTSKSWSKKVKLNQFYLNFGERPDLWPVGPIDLRWDENRKVWTVSNNSSIYKMVYVTLEEDLTKPANHYDETFAARGYLDELEYKTEPLPNGSRRLVYVKDKTGWTAPRGAKLLCRYDNESGFYEPISKPAFNVFGVITGPNQANISLTYIQGKSAGSIPTMKIVFENTLGLRISPNSRGFFNYDGGKWVLISIQTL